MDIPEVPVPQDRIDGWGRIARYLKCDISTAIRWAKTKELPVRQPAGRHGAVHAYRHELDSWLRKRFDGTDQSADKAELPTEPVTLTAPTATTTLPRPSASAFEVLPTFASDDSRFVLYLHRVVWPTTAVAALMVVALVVHSLPIPTNLASNLEATDPVRLDQSRALILSPLLSDGVRSITPDMRTVNTVSRQRQRKGAPMS